MLTIIFQSRSVRLALYNPEAETHKLCEGISRWPVTQGFRIQAQLTVNGLHVQVKVISEVNDLDHLPIRQLKFALMNMLNNQGLLLKYYICLIETGKRREEFSEDIKPLSGKDEMLSGLIGRPRITSFSTELTYERLCNVLAPSMSEIKELKALLNNCNLPIGDFSSDNLAKALRRVAANFSPKEIYLLRRFGVNPNAKDANTDKQRAAIHWAIENVKAENVSALVSMGAHLYLVDARGKTALGYILESDDIKINQLAFFNREKFNNNTYIKVRIGVTVDDSIINTLFHAINECVLKYPSKKAKFELLLEQGLQFVVTDKRKNSTASGEYVPDSNEIYFYYNQLGNTEYSLLIEIVGHEVEHAYKANVNRLYQQQSNVLHEFPTSRYSYALPFYPATMNNLFRLAALIKEGDWRVSEDLLMLLTKKISNNELMPSEQERLTRYISAFANYQPQLATLLIPKKDFPFQNISDALKQIQSGEKIKICRIDVVPRPFWVTHVKEKGENLILTGRYCENVYDFAQAVMALIYQTRDWIFNRQLGNIESDFPGTVAEIHANVAGQLPDQILQTFYPELIQYDQELADSHKEFSAYMSNSESIVHVPRLSNSSAVAAAASPLSSVEAASVPVQDELAFLLKLPINTFIEKFNGDKLFDFFCRSEELLGNPTKFTASELANIKAAEQYLLKVINEKIRKLRADAASLYHKKEFVGAQKNYFIALIYNLTLGQYAKITLGEMAKSFELLAVCQKDAQDYKLAKVFYYLAACNYQKAALDGKAQSANSKYEEMHKQYLLANPAANIADYLGEGQQVADANALSISSLFNNHKATIKDDFLIRLQDAAKLHLANPAAFTTSLAEFKKIERQLIFLFVYLQENKLDKVELASLLNNDFREDATHELRSASQRP